MPFPLDAAVVLLALLALATPLVGQHRRTPVWPATPAPAGSPVIAPLSLPLPESEMQPRLARQLAGGVVGGALGFIVGKHLGDLLECSANPRDDDDFAMCEGPVPKEMSLITGALGEVVLLPLGIHVADRSQGSYGRKLLNSAVIGGFGALIAATQDERFLYVVPMAQLAVTLGDS